MITDGDRKALINYRIEQSLAMIEEVKFLIESEKFSTAVNRIYYGMFYMVTALALIYKYETSKHQQLVGWFNKVFVRTQLIDRKYGRIISESFELRNKGDYEPYIKFVKENVENNFAEMIDFVQTLKVFIENNPTNKL